MITYDYAGNFFVTSRPMFSVGIQTARIEQKGIVSDALSVTRNCYLVSATVQLNVSLLHVHVHVLKVAYIL